MSAKHWTERGFELAHGCHHDRLFVAIPHQLPPLLVNADSHPPDTEGELPDDDFEGDHDLHAHIPVVEALEWGGHQRHKVRALAEQAIAEAAEQS